MLIHSRLRSFENFLMDISTKNKVQEAHIFKLNPIYFNKAGLKVLLKLSGYPSAVLDIFSIVVAKTSSNHKKYEWNVLKVQFYMCLFFPWFSWKSKFFLCIHVRSCTLITLEKNARFVEAIKALNLGKLAKLCSLRLVALHLLTVKD